MQNPSHTSTEEKFAMNFSAFDPELFGGPHMGAAMGGMGVGMKRSAHDAGLDREPLGLSSDDDDLLNKDNKLHQSSGSRDMLHHHTNLDQHGGPPNQQQQQQAKQSILPNGKKTKGRVKIKMEFIDNKLRRYTTFSKRKTGIMKKAYELSTLTGTQVMLLVASETGHVYTFATRKLQPMITSDAGKALIQTCLNSPDPPPTSHHHDQRMSATGYEETELTYAVTEDEQKDDLNCREDCLANGSSSPTDSSSPPSPSTTSASPVVSCNATTASAAAQALHSGAASSSLIKPSTSVASTAHGVAPQTLPVTLPPGILFASQVTGVPSVTVPSYKAETTTKTSTVLTGGSVVLGGTGGQVVYATTGGGLVYAPQGRLGDTTAPVMFNVPHALQVAHDHGTGSGNTGQLVTLPVALSSTTLQQTAAAVAAVSSAQKITGSQALPTDLSMHIKREDKE